MNDFLGGGGKLDSNLTHSNVGVLNEGDCSKSVDGVGEEIGRKLGLSKISWFIFLHIDEN